MPLGNSPESPVARSRQLLPVDQVDKRHRSLGIERDGDSGRIESPRREFRCHHGDGVAGAWGQWSDPKRACSRRSTRNV
jgi:hypothetical protein